MDQNQLQLKQRSLQEITRRHFFGNSGFGIGSLGLATLLGQELSADETGGLQSLAENPLKQKDGHFPGKAKRVIYLFMAGGPSQLELFDNKPKLQEMDGQVIPESYVANKRFAFLKKDAKLLGTRRNFKRWGECGSEISELLPQLGSCADDVAIIRTMKTDVFNHGPAKLFMNTGFQRFGRPAMGAWVTYGIGSEADDLPGFVVLHSGPRGPRGGTPLWGSGFLPTTYQGVPFLNSADPILNLSNPKGIDEDGQGDFIDIVGDLNRKRLEERGDPEIATRIATYEMAYRMQSSAPELMDLTEETEETLKLYGVQDTAKPSFGRNCLLARRLVERGCRFVQLYHTDWDHHGNPGTNLGEPLDERCRETDTPAAALIKDLKQRGMLDDTLVVITTEFGRTPRINELAGRDHWPNAFSIVMAGGGVQGGQVIGKTDKQAAEVADRPITPEDMVATILYGLGIDHKKTLHTPLGRPVPIADGGKVVTELFS
mgnify:CR=1 FL=1